MNSPDRRRSDMRCPEHPERAPLDVDGKPYCPDQSHDGRPKTHPLGPSPRTRAFGPWGGV